MKMDRKAFEERPQTTQGLDVMASPRKRMKQEGSARKSWSLTDRRTDQEVLSEMGVSLLEPDDSELNDLEASASLVKQSLKRKHDIENVNPNINSVTSPRTKHSPRSPKVLCVSSPSTSKVKSPRSLEKAKPLQSTDLETTILTTYQIDEETPLAQSVSAQYMRHDAIGSVPSEGTSERKKRNSFSGIDQDTINDSCKSSIDGNDCFSTLSDEVILSVFKWLPKRTIAHCMLVCKRWRRVACDETLWQRLDLGNKTLSKGALGRILDRKPIIVRLASSEIGEWRPQPHHQPCRIQYLDLSMCSIDNDTLVHLLENCPVLNKLSLENVQVPEEAAVSIGKCKNLETLNLTMAQGLTAEGVTAIVEGCQSLRSLNISWCNLNEAALEVLVTKLPQRLQRLNLGGARLLTDDNVCSIVQRCPRLLELDVSDCSALQAKSVSAVSALRSLEHLALTRCYNLQPHALTKLSCMPSLQYLEIWGMLPSVSLNALRTALPGIQLNQFMFSAIARPTVGSRRTSIWGLRTRD